MSFLSNVFFSNTVLYFIYSSTCKDDTIYCFDVTLVGRKELFEFDLSKESKTKGVFYQFYLDEVLLSVKGVSRVANLRNIGVCKTSIIIFVSRSEFTDGCLYNHPCNHDL